VKNASTYATTSLAIDHTGAHSLLYCKKGSIWHLMEIKGKGKVVLVLLFNQGACHEGILGE
jgi:hypothetical protein